MDATGLARLFLSSPHRWRLSPELTPPERNPPRKTQVMPDLRWDRSAGSVERLRTVPSFAITLVKASPIPRTDVHRAVVQRVARVCLMEGKHTFLSNVLPLNANMTARPARPSVSSASGACPGVGHSLPRLAAASSPQDVNGVQKWKFARQPPPGAAAPPDQHTFVIRSDLLKSHPGLMIYIEFNVVHEGYIGVAVTAGTDSKRPPTHAHDIAKANGQQTLCLASVLRTIGL